MSLLGSVLARFTVLCFDFYQSGENDNKNERIKNERIKNERIKNERIKNERSKNERIKNERISCTIVLWNQYFKEVNLFLCRIENSLLSDRHWKISSNTVFQSFLSY